MPNSGDEKRSHGTLYEQLGINNPWLAKELQENKLFYLYASTVYAAEDALNLAFSFYSLGFAMNDACHEQNDAHSGSEFHDFEQTIEGLAVSIAGAVFLVAFSSLGTYFADAELKDGIIKYYLGNSWSYVRDMLKAMKWAYKGIRSTLILILQLSGHQALLAHILFPITIVLGLLAVFNRIWLRKMRSDRKAMMKDNDALYEQIVAKTNFLKVLQIPEDQDLTDALNTFIDKEALKYCNSFVYVNQGPTQQLFYVDKVTEDKKNSAKLIPILIDMDAFDQNIQLFQSENLCKRMSLNLISGSESQLHFFDELPKQLNTDEKIPGDILLDPMYANSVIYLTNPALPSSDKFYVVDQAGKARLDSERSQKFEQELQEERKKARVLGITPQQMRQLIPDTLEQHPIKYSYQAWVEYKSSVKFYKQSDGLPAYCYVAVAYSALIDGLYFYMGVLFVTTLNPHLFIAMLAMSSALFVICMLARLYEEYDYQRKLEITQIKVLMALCETESRLLDLNFTERLVAAEQQHELSPQEILNKLYLQAEEYETLQQRMQSKLVLGFTSVLLAALYNGLAFQGVISSLMFLIMAILVLSSTTCPPVLVFTFMSVGMAGFIAVFTQHVISYRAYIAKLKEEKKGTQDELTWKIQYQACKSDIELCQSKNDEASQLKLLDLYELQRKILLKATIDMEARALDPIQKFELLGWWEVLRLLFSGIVKAEKTYGELTLDRTNHDETWVRLLVSVIFAVIIGIIFALRTISKMFAEPEKTSPVELETIKNTTWKFSLWKNKTPSALLPVSPGASSEHDPKESHGNGSSLPLTLMIFT